MPGEQTTKYLYVEVAPATPLTTQSRQTYTYRLPRQAKNLLAFTRVTVPFGRRSLPGIITEICTEKVPYPTKEAQLLAPFQLTLEQVRLARWISETRQGGFGFTLRLFFPAAKRFPKIGKIEDKLLKLTKLERTIADKFIDKAAQRPAVLLERDIDKRIDLLITLAGRIAEGKRQTLVVVPERWLLEKFKEKFQARFGGQVAFVDSKITAKEEARVWQSVKEGKITVVVGTQKAMYLPYQSLGLIVLEEESYSTHKLWDAYPRLDNRDVVAYMAEIYKSSLVYAGSFPSLALHAKIAADEVTLVHNEPTKIRTDLVFPSARDRLQRHFIPDEMVRLLRRWKQQKKRVLVIHNRRGSWSSLVCRSCHTVSRCPDCGVALLVEGANRKKKTLSCRHCEYHANVPEKCPSCSSSRLSPFGVGAEELSETIKKVLASRSVLTLDKDSVSRWTHEKLVQHFKSRPGTVVVGTTAALRLIGPADIDQVVFALPERSLLYPDFRSNERTLILLARLQQLLPTQRSLTVMTRYRRLVQEYLEQSVDKLYEKQLKERRQLRYPPTSDMARLTVSGLDENKARRKAVALREELEKRNETGAVIRGPFQSFVRLRRGKVEMHLLLLGELPALVKMYNGLPIDTVDVSPARVL